MTDEIDQDVREAADDFSGPDTAWRPALLQAFVRMKAAGREQGLREAVEVARNFGYSEHDCGEPPFEGAPGFWGTITVDNRKGNEAAIATAIEALLSEKPA